MQTADRLGRFTASSYRRRFHFRRIRTGKSNPGMGSRQFHHVIYIPQADAVTYHFLRARLFLLDTNYAEADRFLAYAFRYCHPASQRNRRTILAYMVPVKLNLGLLPRPGLLERYNLKEFGTLVHALRVGDFRLYQQQLDCYQNEFISRGVYIILEKLKLFVYRNFIKKM